MQKEKICCAVIGTGFGARTILPALVRNGHFNIKYLIGNNIEKTRSIAFKFNIKNYTQTFADILTDSDLNALFIATPHHIRYQLLKLCIPTNLHLFVEKPLCNTIEEIEEILELNKSSDKLRLITHQLPYYPPFIEIRDLLSNNTIGDIVHARICYQSNRLTLMNNCWDWCFDADNGGGMLIAVGTHLVTLAQYLFGPEILTLHAQTEKVYDNLLKANHEYKKNNSEALFNINLTMGKNIKVNLYSTGSCFQKDCFELSILGTNGEITFHSNKGCFVYCSNNNKLEIKEIPFDRSVSLWRVSYNEYIDNIVQYILNSTNKLNSKYTTFKKYRTQFNIIELAKKSSKHQIVINVDEHREDII